MKGRLLVVAMLVTASPLLAEDNYRYGRIRYAESGVTIQRGSETSSEVAEANVPLLPGDRVWTDAGGRAEFQFADGSLVRLDGRSKLEYLSAEDGQPNVIRLYSGSLFLHAWAADPGFEVETPGGLVETVERGVYRVDVENGEVRLSVYEGQATLASGRRRVRVEDGERAYARRGDEPDEPRRFDSRDQDEFARWDQDREGRVSWASERRQYVPDEVAPYAGELESHGSWSYQAEVGYVWRPYVASGWRPYCNGRWAWTAYGWTWIPQEPWGWAPFHYGRWDYASNLGWYWIPGHSWGPAWVHWAVGTDYVGWCPRGYRDRIVPYYGQAYRGNAVGRGGGGAWVYSERGQMSVGFAGRRPVAAATAVRDVRLIDAPHSRPTRDLRSVETVGTKPSFRAVRTKPTIGDTVPELRSDNSTTIPAPVVRRRASDSPRYDRGHATAAGEGAAPRQAKPRAKDPDFSGVDPELRSRPRTSSRDWPQRTGSSSGEAKPRTEAQPRFREPEATNASDRGEARTQDRARSSDPDRDVLRRMFKPVTETPRERGGGSSAPSWRNERSEGRSSGARERTQESRPRPTESRPTTAAPRTPSRPAPAAHGEARPKAQTPTQKRPPKERQ